MYLTPAEYVYFVFGGISETARIVGRHPSAVGRWNKPRENRGSNGYIPTTMQRKIIKIAFERGLDITPRDLLFGREVSEQ